MQAGAVDRVYDITAEGIFVMTSIATSSSTMLDLAQASEVRNSDGTRRYGSIDTLRRRVRSGELPYERDGRNKYLVSVEDLNEMRSARKAERDFAELKAVAERVAAAAPPISLERRKMIISILNGSD